MHIIKAQVVEVEAEVEVQVGMEWNGMGFLVV